MQDTFKKIKQSKLNKKDKSYIGKWDKDIKKLCNKINKNKNYYTTSSCSGRITLIKSIDKKARNIFLFSTHNKINFKQLKTSINQAIEKYKRKIYFKMDACALHVVCKNLESALSLLRKARKCGWKNSGIISKSNNKNNLRFTCQLVSTESLELPIADKAKLLISDDFLKLLVKEANLKLKRTREKIQRLEKKI